MSVLRTSPLALLLALPLFALAGACTDGSDDEAEMDVPGGKADNPTPAAVGLDSRPSNPTCTAPDRPPSTSSASLVRAFPNISFTKPVAMVQRPGSSSWYLVEQRGVVWRFSDSDSVTSSSVSVALDHRSSVEDGPNEAGLLGIAFHPDFAQNGEVYLSYTLTSQGQLHSVISRMTSSDGGATFNAGSEDIILSVRQPFGNHNGGSIAFGPDGFLYVGFGDGGSANDPQGNGQNKQTRLGKVLRINVDSGSPFSVPFDNPFAQGGGLGEIYAWGIRNPWKFSFDQATGNLWLADVGQDEWEEVNIIEKGGNYGWNDKEGFECFDDPFPCNGPIDPVAVYNHSQGRSITGGYVYRGTDIPGLNGRYIFGDYVSGRIWGLFPNADDGELEMKLLVSSNKNVSSFAQDHDGEMYALSWSDGTIHRLAPELGQTGNFPTKLSQTGCVSTQDPTQMVAGAIPYTVNSPLWSDGAGKERWMAIPNGRTINVQQDGDFTFPIGTVLIKTFWKNNRRLETRLMVRHDDGGWAGYPYEWNASQTDATLVTGGKTISAGFGDTWTIPSQSDCSSCHTSAAGFALGPEIIQLNGDGVYPSTNRISNQTATLANIGLFSNVGTSVDWANVPALPALDDTSASLQNRSRAYLHSNCSHCHRPSGPGRSDADMRFLVAFGSQNMCNEVPETGSLGITGARVIRPGDSDRSLVVERMQRTDVHRMPPLGTSEADATAVATFSAWIDSLSGCP